MLQNLLGACIYCYLTQPFNPHQNGVVERRNRSLQDITRCLLLSKHLPNYLSGEAIRVATIILKLWSTKAYPITTPNELITRKKPDISTFHIFGCTVYVHIPGSKRSKLDSHTPKCIYLAMTSMSKDTIALICQRSKYSSRATSVSLRQPSLSHLQNQSQQSLRSSTKALPWKFRRSIQSTTTFLWKHPPNPRVVSTVSLSWQSRLHPRKPWHIPQSRQAAPTFPAPWSHPCYLRHPNSWCLKAEHPLSSRLNH